MSYRDINAGVTTAFIQDNVYSLDSSNNLTNIYGDHGNSSYGVSAINDSSAGRDSFALLPEQRVGKFLIVYGNLLIVVLGFIGNPLSFVVSRQRAHTSSPHFYMTVLALWDFSFIVFRTIYNYRDQMGIVMGQTACKMFHFLFPYTSHCAVWTLVAMTAERYVAIWFPWKMTASLAVKRAKIIAIVVALTSFGLNLHVIWTWSALYRGTKVKCRINNDVKIYFEWIDDIFYSFAPFIVIVILNVFIIIGLRQKEMKRAHMRQGTNRDSNQNKTQKQITWMLLTVAMSFAVLTGPKCISALVFRHAKPKTATPHDRAVNFLVFVVFDLLVVLQHCINFYLYFLTGKIFRKELKQLLQCSACKCRKTLYGHTPIETKPVRKAQA